MIYTVGHTESYLQYFEEQVSPKKKGRDKDCDGGTVWETEKEALKACPVGYSVFGVEADWDKDTAISEDGTCQSLLVDSLLVMIKDKQNE